MLMSKILCRYFSFTWLFTKEKADEEAKPDEKPSQEDPLQQQAKEGPKPGEKASQEDTSH